MSRLRPADPAGWLGRLRAVARVFAKGARLAVGIPDYENYVAHRRQHHPAERVMSYEEFFRERLGARYRKGSSRCC
ncbi:MAG: YbdD/YjiX family protein [Nevskia sp.]|nr:YbdD/YjiX family protein [Nevskia sp.]